MTTKEAFEDLKHKFPTRRVRVSDTLDTNWHEDPKTFMAQVDDDPNWGETYEIAIAGLKVKTTAQIAQEKREAAESHKNAAAALLEEAAKLEKEGN